MALFYYKEKKNKGIRAAAYLRLSIEDGDKAESNSIGNQRELIQNFVAERPELHLVGEYADDGYTGTNFERPGFTQMMEDIQSDKINCIIVKDLSRLGRNYIEMGKYLERIFPMMGIRFIAINDNYDNANTESSDSDSIVVPFKNLLNDSYCRDISIKVRSQLDIKRRKGEFIGGYAVYGSLWITIRTKNKNMIGRLRRCRIKLNNPRRKKLPRALFQERYAQRQNRQKISCTARDLRQVWYRPSSKMFMCMRVGESLYSSNMSRVYRMP